MQPVVPIGPAKAALFQVVEDLGEDQISLADAHGVAMVFTGVYVTIPVQRHTPAEITLGKETASFSSC